MHAELYRLRAEQCREYSALSKEPSERKAWILLADQWECLADEVACRSVRGRLVASIVQSVGSWVAPGAPNLNRVGRDSLTSEARVRFAPEADVQSTLMRS